jgi:hypothetical protein
VTRARDCFLKRRNNKNQKAHHEKRKDNNTVQERERESTVNGTNRTYKEVEEHFKYNVELQ